jgi:thioredoxin reductase (NADPH)
MSEEIKTHIIMYGADWCPDCRRAKAFLDKHNISYRFNDIELNQESVKRVEAINKGKRIIPTFEILGKSYTNPDNIKLSCVLGINPQGRIVFYGADWCPDCRRAKAFLDGHGIHYQFIDVDKFPWATEIVQQINNGKRIIPTILIDDTAYPNPDNARLKELLKLEEEEETTVYDVVIVGAGAAGLTTAIYAQRDKLSAVILEKKNIGGNAFLTEKIENYPGFTSISGPGLMSKMAEQARIYGAEIREGVEVKDIKKKEDFFFLSTNMGEFIGKTVVFCLGSTYRQLNIPGEKELIGSGIHFCATCDGPFYRDKDVIVIGGGNSALEEGIFLSRFCKSVKIVHRSKTFTATPTYVEKLETISNIHTFMNKTSTGFIAGAKGLFNALQIKDNETGREELLQADGVFIFIGLVPNTAFLKGIIELDEKGFIKTMPGCVETSVRGIFAAGDCRKGAVAQIAAATGEGVIASFNVKEYLKN